MSRLLMLTFSKWSIGLAATLPALALAAGPTTDYYSSNIDEAVQAAKRNPTNTNTVGKRWYGRSTSRSISMPPLLNAELDTELIGNDIEIDNSEPVKSEVSQNSTAGTALGRDKKYYLIDEQKNDQLPDYAVTVETYTIDFIGDDSYHFGYDENKPNETRWGQTDIIHVHGGTTSMSYYK